MPSTPLTTGDFLRAVLPSAGVYYAARLLPRQGRNFVQEPCASITDLAVTVKSYDLNHQDAYFAVASYRDGSSRKKDNTLSYRSVWTDIDVGKPGAYADKKAALGALIGICEQDAGLPRPNVVVISGYGVHAYWTFDRDLSPPDWYEIACRLQAVQRHYGLKADHTITVDYARVLRPVGTRNFKKRDNPQDVSGRRLGPDLDPDDFLALLSARCDELSLDLKAPPQRSSKLDGDLADLVAGIDPEYPPSDAEKIADACLVIGEMRDTRGVNQDNNLWYASLLVLNKTVQADAVAHLWSEGHQDYDPSVVDRLLERLRGNDAKPAGCAHFRTVSPLCAACTLKIKNPISLGFPDRRGPPRNVDPDAAGEAKEIPDIFGDGRYRWSDQKGLQVKVQAKKVKTQAEGDEADSAAPVAADEEIWITCSQQYPVVDFLWYDHNEGEYYARLRARVKERSWTEADLKLAVVGQGGSALARDLAGKAKIFSTGSNQHLESYMKTWIDNIQRHTDTQHVRNAMGWQTDKSFLLGKTLYTPEGEALNVAVGRQLANYIGAHAPKGDLDRCVELLDQLYNRPKYEPHQFALMASLGSALLHLVWPGPVGIPLSLWSTETGIGKSTLAKVGIALWGDPHSHGQYANAKGTTELAFYTLAGQRRHLPVLLDETSPWDGPRLSDFVYRYSDGTPKQQARAEGGLRDNSHISWCNMIYLTSNKSVINMISTSHRGAAAQVARVFEYELPDMKLSVGDQHLLDELFHHTGLIGHKFIAFLAKDGVRETVTKLVKAKVQELYGRSGLGTEARYWVHLAAAALVAGQLAFKLKLFKFNVALVDRWVRTILEKLGGAANLAMEDPEDTFSDLLRDLYPGILVTLNEGRAFTGATIAPNTWAPRGPLNGRMIIEHGVLYLAVGAINQWCTKNGVDVRLLRGALLKNKHMEGVESRVNLGRGTHIPSSSRVRCWKLVGNLIVEVAQDIVSGQGNVVRGNFRAKQQDADDLTLPVDEVRADAECP